MILVNDPNDQPDFLGMKFEARNPAYRNFKNSNTGGVLIIPLTPNPARSQQFSFWRSNSVWCPGFSLLLTHQHPKGWTPNSAQSTKMRIAGTVALPLDTNL